MSADALAAHPRHPIFIDIRHLKHSLTPRPCPALESLLIWRVGQGLEVKDWFTESEKSRDNRDLSETPSTPGKPTAATIRWDNDTVAKRWNELKQVYREIFPEADISSFGLKQKQDAVQEILLIRAAEIDSFTSEFRNQAIAAITELGAPAKGNICEAEYLWQTEVCFKCSLAPGYLVSRNGYCQSCQQEERLMGQDVPSAPMPGYEWTPDADDAVKQGIAAESWRRDGQSPSFSLLLLPSSCFLVLPSFVSSSF